MATNVFMATNISLLDVGHCLMFGFPRCFTLFSFLPFVGVKHRRVGGLQHVCYPVNLLWHVRRQMTKLYTVQSDVVLVMLTLVPKIKARSRTFQPWECPQTDGGRDRYYQMYYLPTTQSIINKDLIFIFRFGPHSWCTVSLNNSSNQPQLALLQLWWKHPSIFCTSCVPHYIVLSPTRVDQGYVLLTHK